MTPEELAEMKDIAREIWDRIEKGFFELHERACAHQLEVLKLLEPADRVEYLLGMESRNSAALKASLDRLADLSLAMLSGQPPGAEEPH